MADQWTIKGVEYGNCNCDYGCPCQFTAPTTHGKCEAIVCGRIDEGHFNDTTLEGLKWAMVVAWPGEIAEGNGRQQVIIDDSADAAQREALKTILHGGSTAPGGTHFFVYNSTMSEVLETLYAPVDVEIDIAARKASLNVSGVVQSTGVPIINPHSGDEHLAEIRLPNGFEYTVAHIGSGTTKATGAIQLDLSDSYGQFNELHMNQDGVIR